MESFKQVYRWRTGASTVWTILLNIPCLLLIVVLSCFSQSSLWFMLYMIPYLLSLIVIQLVYSATATAKFVIHKNRFEKIWNCVCPSHLFVHCVFVVMATVEGVALMELTGGSVVSQQDNLTDINISYLMSILFCAYLGLVFSIKYFNDRNYVLIFPVIQQKKIFRLRGHFRSSVVTAFFNSIKYWWSFAILYCLSGSYFKRLVEIIFTLKPSDHTYWNSLCDLFYPRSLLHMMLCGVVIHLSWSWTLRFFRVYHTQALQFPVLPSFANQSNCTLLTALSSNDYLYKHLGFLDLCQLSENSLTRRKQVFTLAQSGTPAVWNDIQQHCMSIIEKLITELGASNQLMTKTIQPTTPLIPSTDKKLHGFKGRSETGQSGLLTRRDVVHERARLWSHGSVIETELPKPMKKKPENGQPDLKKEFNQVKNKAIARLKKQRLVAYFISELPVAKERKPFVDSQLVVWSVTTLSQLIVASYAEDNYGVVQQNLQSIIANLILLLQVMDKKVVHLLTRATPLDKIAAIEINGKYAVKSAVVTGLQMILHTFKDIRFLHLSQDQINACRKLQILHSL